MNGYSVKDKVVIVTGGGTGIGAGITEAFYQQGAKVVLNFRSNEQRAVQLKETLNATDDTLILVKADISTTEGREALIKKTLEHFDHIDVLVNNAGIAAKKRFLKGTEDEFDDIIHTNLKAPIFLSQACATSMIAANIQGSIINICSVSGHIPNAPASYSASKAGLLMATKSMALDLAPHKIRVNNVTPGTIQSDMNRPYWEEKPDTWREHTSKIPLDRAGEPKELASAVLFLSSDDSSFVTGSEITVDGGWSLKPYW